MKVKRVLVVPMVPLLCALNHGCGGGGGGSVKHIVPIRYTVGPQTGLPVGLKSVAVLPAELTPATDPMWSDLASTILQNALQDAKSANRLPLEIVARRETPKILAEQDLAAAGLVPSDRPGAPAQLQAIEGFITSKVDVITEEAVGTSTTISNIDISGLIDKVGGSDRSRPPTRNPYRRSPRETRAGNIGVDTREAQKIVRTMTVSTTFTLIDSVTGKEWATSSSTETGTEEEKPSLFFGRDKSVADLTPRDKIIGSLVEKAARRFVAKIVPTAVSTEVELKSSSHPESIAGVKAMRADQYDEAMMHLQAAIAADPGDHRSMFAAGAACEYLGRYEEALKYYRMAAAEDDKEEYVRAKDRLRQHVERIGGSANGE